MVQGHYPRSVAVFARHGLIWPRIYDRAQGMAGSHNVLLARRHGGHQFEVSAIPAHLLSRVPVLGPTFTYNLGRNPRFTVSVKYLGHVASQGDDPDPHVFPNPAESGLWDFDLYLKIGGQPSGPGDDLRVDLDTAKLEHNVARSKRQLHSTTPFPLTRTGNAELMVGVPNISESSLYSFEIKDTTLMLTTVLLTAVFTTIGGILGGLVVWLLGR